MAEIADLESLSTKDLHDRAVKLAARRGDIKFLWELLKSIPGAEVAAGNQGEGEVDIWNTAALLDDYVHAGEGKIGEVLRPMYVDYLSKHA
ncbi:hypothetical protein [Nocardia concava]|uniref:hypothetical protein n=1 Tax=Nocardia concava TaxID=257281 RepID=UPI000318B7BF|nr:hypothetical protein [Nocardia concava]